MTQDITQKVVEVFRTVFLDIATTPDQELVKMTREDISGWDSVNHLLLITALEDSFSIQLPDGAGAEIESFQDAEKIVKSLFANEGQC